MTQDEARRMVLDALRQIAPEADLENLDPTEDLREQLDIDSMDFLNFALGLNEACGLDIPERDYPKMATLQGCIGYLMTQASVAAN